MGFEPRLIEFSLVTKYCCPFNIPSIGNVTTETDLKGSAIPEYWQAFDTLISPSVIAQGTLNIDTDSTPDRVRFTNYGSASSNLWDYTRAVGNSNGDSAVCLYWNPKSLTKDQSMTCKTYLGLSSLQQDNKPPLAVSLSGVTKLNVVDNGFESYSPNPFTVTAYIQNIGTGTANNVNVKLTLPKGMKIVYGSESISLNDIDVGVQRQVSWQVVVDPDVVGKTNAYSVMVTAKNTNTKILERKIEVPVLNTRKYKAMVGSGWKTITLKGSLNSYNNIHSDDDGLSDWNEIDKNSKLVKISTDGKYIKSLPTIQECIEFASKSYGYPTYIESSKDLVQKLAISNPDILKIRILPIKSDPTNLDTDGDGYADGPEDIFKNRKFDDRRPLKNDVIKTKLKGSDEWIKIDKYYYSAINGLLVNKKEGEVGEYHYGGNQSWMNDNTITSKTDINLRDGGCGIIAGCDVIAYLSMKNSNNLPLNISGIDIFNKGINDNTVIGKTEYTNYATYMGNNNFKPWVGFIPDIASIFNGQNTLGVLPKDYVKTFNNLNIGIKATENEVIIINTLLGTDIIAVKQSYIDNLLDKVKKSIKNDIPVTILYLFNNAKFYKYDEYLLKPIENEKMWHYINVTEIIEDKISGDIVLTISSWGKKYQIIWSEFIYSCESFGLGNRVILYE